MVALIQAVFGEGRRVDDSTWQAVVLIPKGGGDYRGICLVEVVWKVVAVIPNFQFTASINFHDVLHGFWAGSRTGITSLEAKLLQQLAAMSEEVLYIIFLDLHKVVCRLGQGHMTRYPGGVWSGNAGPLHTLIIMGHTTDGS